MRQRATSNLLACLKEKKTFRNNHGKKEKKTNISVKYIFFVFTVCNKHAAHHYTLQKLKVPSVFLPNGTDWVAKNNWKWFCEASPVMQVNHFVRKAF